MLQTANHREYLTETVPTQRQRTWGPHLCPFHCDWILNPNWQEYIKLCTPSTSPIISNCLCPFCCQLCCLCMPQIILPFEILPTIRQDRVVLHLPHSIFQFPHSLGPALDYNSALNVIYKLEIENIFQVYILLCSLYFSSFKFYFEVWWNSVNDGDIHSIKIINYLFKLHKTDSPTIIHQL